MGETGDGIGVAWLSIPLPLKEYGGLTLAIVLIMAAAGMVLVVACANVGSLQLARARRGRTNCARACL